MGRGARSATRLLPRRVGTAKALLWAGAGAGAGASASGGARRARRGLGTHPGRERRLGDRSEQVLGLRHLRRLGQRLDRGRLGRRERLELDRLQKRRQVGRGLGRAALLLLFAGLRGRCHEQGGALRPDALGLGGPALRQHDPHQRGQQGRAVEQGGAREGQPRPRPQAQARRRRLAGGGRGAGGARRVGPEQRGEGGRGQATQGERCRARLRSRAIDAALGPGEQPRRGRLAGRAQLAGTASMAAARSARRGPRRRAPRIWPRRGSSRPLPSLRRAVSTATPSSSRSTGA